jgi:hypothetical protein
MAAAWVKPSIVAKKTMHWVVTMSDAKWKARRQLPVKPATPPNVPHVPIWVARFSFLPSFQDIDYVTYVSLKRS